MNCVRCGASGSWTPFTPNCSRCGTDNTAKTRTAKCVTHDVTFAHSSRSLPLHGCPAGLVKGRGWPDCVVEQ